MSKKNEIRVICVSREAFFSLIETFIYDKIRGVEPPEGYHGIIPDVYRDDIWHAARFVSGADLNENDEIILNYQNDTISRLHNLGCSYRVLDRKGDSDDYQLSLLEGSEVEE